MEDFEMKNSALVVIDLQNDITKNYKEIIQNVNKAIDWAVEQGLWVIYIQHNNLSAKTRTFKPGTHGAEMVSELNVVSDHIFMKTKSNALTSEDFTAFLQKYGITEFYIGWCRRRRLHQIHLLQYAENRLSCSCAVRLHHQL